MSKSKKEQQIFKNKEKKRLNRILILLVCAILAAVVALITVSVIALTPKKAPFVPPEFDAEATEGVPDISEPATDTYRPDYQKIYKDGMTFSAYGCGEVNISDGKADIYFTNPEENTLWMKLRVFDEQGNVIAETGLIKPYEYLMTITFDTIPEDGTKIMMKIMTYEPETYYSGGAVSLATTAIVK